MLERKNLFRQHKGGLSLSEYAIYLPKELPSRSLLERYETQEAWFVNPRQAYGTQHDIGHLTRVLILQELFANKLQEVNPHLILDREALRWAASTHDVRKKGEYELNFRIHGIRASKWVEQQFAPQNPSISPEAISRIGYLNYYHSFKEHDIPKSYPIELKVLRDADAADILRLTHAHPVIRKVPTFMKDLLYERLRSGMHYEAVQQLMQFAEQLAITSTRKSSYGKYPFNSVLEAGEELGLVKA